MKREHWPLLLIPFALGLLLPNCMAPPKRVAFLSVGQGDCTLVQAGGFTALVDAAPASPGMDGGERLAVPELRRLGVKEIDLVILTHPDADHIGGLAAISRKFPIRRVAFAEHFRSHPALVEVLSSLPSSTEKWALVRDEVLRWPGGEILIDFVPPSSRNDDNDGSVAGIVRVGPGSLVFTGDASAKIESTLAERGDWSAQILKLGHHGSDDATSSPWIEEVQPLYAVASSGRTNSYGHPGPKVQERLESAGIPLYRTDEEGTVIFELGPKGFYRPSR